MNAPRPNPSRRRHELSLMEGPRAPPLLYSQKKQGPSYLSGGNSSVYARCSPGGIGESVKNVRDEQWSGRPSTSTTAWISQQVTFISSGLLKKHLASRYFRTDSEVQEAVIKWLRDLDLDFFFAGFERLVYRWHKCFNNYVGK
ncbi:hypothetical protein AVEN_41431-1 [Araneus ventricosus]|uniref:Uncharacterized protein n=1 Tax=Araneus ventricosus TaxID=182803 RepID=A0A4Y2P4E8_ARAVE|nr:hypothetical protein AVEN_41431-1 [Araneus ventricosus]